MLIHRLDPANSRLLHRRLGHPPSSAPAAAAAPPATIAESPNGSDAQYFYLGRPAFSTAYNLRCFGPSAGGRGNLQLDRFASVRSHGWCPSDLKVTQSGSDAGVACKSACEAFGTEEYCCSGAYGNPNTCKPTRYSRLFKNACPRAYSYAYDDGTSTFTCENADYVITFCPAVPRQKEGKNDPQAAGLPLINEAMVFQSGVEGGRSSSMGSVLLIVATTLVVSWRG
ncbi:thaumatin-like protein [Asparagus officinalis]|uniref:thaumatin-like protein n=1 Tax=Asparagus officinalis TaxID=4686 RepID=UPI00098E2A02|nr:thaumatin-like protein [Asparagus officinalis]